MALVAAAALYERRIIWPVRDRGYRSNLVPIIVFAATLLLVSPVWAACGGGGGGEGGHSGTPPGSTTLSVTATHTPGATTLQHTQTLPLTVN